ncbi:MAG: acyl carrier protein [Bacteroidia bacterium]
MAFPNSKRKVTLNERLFEVAESIIPPFALQYIIEGTGLLEPEHVRNCLIQLVEKLPVFTLVLKGNRWAPEGGSPAFFVHEKPFSPDWNDPFFQNPIRAENGYCAELHLFQGQSSTVVFRVQHKVMDAKGIQLALYSLFALLRGETIHPDTNFSSDMEERGQLVEKETVVREGYASKWPGFRLSPQDPYRYKLGVITLDFRLEGTLAKCGSWYAQTMGEACRVIVPVDMRRHKLVSNTASNLSLPVYLSVNPGETWQEIQARLLSALAENQELAKERLEKWVLMIPRQLLAFGLKQVVKRTAKTGRFPMSGILSDNGWMDLRGVSTSSFLAKSVISLPVYVSLSPFCLAVIHHNDRTNIAFTVPAEWDVESLKNSLMESLLTDQQTKPVEVVAVPGNSDEVKRLSALWAEVLECPVTSISPDATFHYLGGDSLKLLFMLSEVSSEYSMNSDSAFFNAVLNTGGHITIQSLIGIMDQFRAQNING